MLITYTILLSSPYLQNGVNPRSYSFKWRHINRCTYNIHTYIV